MTGVIFDDKDTYVDGKMNGLASDCGKTLPGFWNLSDNIVVLQHIQQNL